MSGVEQDEKWYGDAHAAGRKWITRGGLWLSGLSIKERQRKYLLVTKLRKSERVKTEKEGDLKGEKSIYRESSVTRRINEKPRRPLGYIRASVENATTSG